jgi:hypothetical protein
LPGVESAVASPPAAQSAVPAASGARFGSCATALVIGRAANAAVKANLEESISSELLLAESDVAYGV